MLQRWIHRMSEIAQKNDKGGQWQQVAVGTHIEHVSDMGQPAFYEADLPDYLQSPYEEKLLSIPGIYACIPHGLIHVYLEEESREDSES